MALNSGVLSGFSYGVINASGSITGAGVVSNTTSTVGYTVGAGGAVTQLTSKSTAVTLNNPCGAIAMNNAALAAGTSVTFILNNSTIGTYDTVISTLRGGVTLSSNYRVETEQCSSGICRIRVTNLSAGSLSEAVTINFCVIRGSAT